MSWWRTAALRCVVIRQGLGPYFHHAAHYWGIRPRGPSTEEPPRRVAWLAATLSAAAAVRVMLGRGRGQVRDLAPRRRPAPRPRVQMSDGEIRLDVLGVNVHRARLIARTLTARHLLPR